MLKRLGEVMLTTYETDFGLQIRAVRIWPNGTSTELGSVKLRYEDGDVTAQAWSATVNAEFTLCHKVADAEEHIPHGTWVNVNPTQEGGTVVYAMVIGYDGDLGKYELETPFARTFWAFAPYVYVA